MASDGKSETIIDKFLKFFDDFGIAGWIVPGALLLLVAFFVPLSFWASVVSVSVYVLPFFAVFVLAYLFGDEWMHYVVTHRYFTTDYVLLELRLPTEITQSPLAMETALNAFYETGEPDTPYAKYWEGKNRPQSSLEIVSLEGEVHFYVWTRAAKRNFIEAALYAQYPTIEIHEVPDYVTRIRYDRTKMDIWGIETELQKDDVYPIKTYMDFGLDKEQEEEYKVDPMNSLLEFFGSFGKGEYGFFQLIIGSHDVKEFRKEGEELIQKIVEQQKQEKEDAKLTIFKPLTKDKENAIASLARNMAKKPFDAGIRVLYIADNEHYNRDRQAGLPTMMRSFEAHDSNGFKPIFPTSFKYPWMDIGKRKSEAAKKELFDAYRWRSYMDAPFHKHGYVLSSEEVATVFHLPGQVAKTPTLTRITSRKAEAPANLPRG